MSFEEYLESKKIDPVLFQNEDPAKWKELKNFYAGSGPQQFTNGKKFIINPIRRLYHFKEKAPILQPVTAPSPATATTGTGSPVRKKPVFKK